MTQAMHSPNQVNLMQKLNTTGTSRMNMQQYFQPYTMLTSPGNQAAPIYYHELSSYAPSENITKKKVKKRSTSGGLKRKMSKKDSISPSSCKKAKKKSKSSTNVKMSTLSSYQIEKLYELNDQYTRGV